MHLFRKHSQGDADEYAGAVETHVSLLVEQGKEIPRKVTTTFHFPKPVNETDVQHWRIERLEIEVLVEGRTTNELASA